MGCDQKTYLWTNVFKKNSFPNKKSHQTLVSLKCLLTKSHLSRLLTISPNLTVHVKMEISVRLVVTWVLT